MCFLPFYHSPLRSTSRKTPCIARRSDSGLLDEFVSALVNTTCDNIENIDECISTNSKGWKINRIPKVTLAIIRMALAEILYFDDVPDGVAVNEAVELAKKYSTPEDASYINGLLGTVVRSK